MQRSLSTSLVLAFLLVALTGAALAASFTYFATLREFNNLVVRQAQSRFVEQVVGFYQAAGSWAGVREHMRILPREERPLSDRDPGGSPPFIFLLAEPDGQVVLPAGKYRLGDRLSARDLARSQPVTSGGQVIARVLPTGEVPVRDATEERFLRGINRALLLAAFGAALIAILLGALLARTLIRPLRELTGAAQAIASGNLAQRVPVRSQDELGELATAFNQMSADLEHANQLRRQMTADIAHDLRTPLTVISGYLESLRDGVLAPTPERFSAMHAEAQRLQRLVEDLRTLSLADAGELRLQRQPADPVALLQRVAAAFEAQAHRARVELHVQAPADLPLVAMDEERMVQVLGNLLSNALRHTPPGGRVTLRAAHTKGALLLEVADSGTGIAAEDLPYIFDRFYRGDRARQQTGDESGLGLAISKSIVDAHHGQIAAASQPGQGATITIRLPQE